MRIQEEKARDRSFSQSQPSSFSENMRNSATEKKEILRCCVKSILVLAGGERREAAKGEGADVRGRAEGNDEPFG